MSAAVSKALDACQTPADLQAVYDKYRDVLRRDNRALTLKWLAAKDRVSGVPVAAPEGGRAAAEPEPEPLDAAPEPWEEEPERDGAERAGRAQPSGRVRRREVGKSEWERRLHAAEGLTMRAKAVGYALAVDADYATGANAWPSLDRLARGCGGSRSTARRALTTLAEAGWLQRTGTHSHGPSVWQLTVPLP